MRKLALELFTAVLVLMLMLPAAEAAGKSNLMLIFDASGSMWGQIDGKAKITIAKEAMDQIVKELPEDINIGLVAYGHRRKGDCDDVQTLIPLGPLDKTKLLARVKGLSPKGKTPMVRSIRQTAEAIKHLEDETTILLISDGEETCDPEPCNFVGELKKLGIKFVLHVVGFDVGGKTEEQLKCMAKAGGGEYFPAKDAGKLTEALTTVIEKTVEKNLKVSIFLNGKPIGGTVEVKNPETGDQAGSRSSSEPLPLMLGVAPGTYTVTVFDEWHQEGRPSLVFENVEVNDTEVRDITANFGSGTLTVWTLKNGEPFKASVHVTTMDDQTVGGGYTTTYPDKPASYLLQPGQYKLFAVDSWGTGATQDLGVVEIASGQTLEKKAVFDSGELIVWTHKNGKPFHASVIVTDKNGQTMGGGWGTTYPDKPAAYVLEPGIYALSAEDSWGDPVVKMDFGTVEIIAGKTLKKICDFDARAPAQDSGKDSSQNQIRKPADEPAAAVAEPKKEDIAIAGQTASDPSQQTGTAAQSPQDIQAMADQMQADAIAKMQAAMSQIQGMQLPQTASAPQIQEDQAGQTKNSQVGAPPSTADYTHVGAQDTGGGLEEDGDQGKNPYEGMTKEEMQAAFAKDMGMQGPPGTTTGQEEFKVGTPLTTKRHIMTLENRLNTCQEKASALNRQDILTRIDAARKNLDFLDRQLKARADNTTLQQLLDQCVQENNAINISIAQVQ